MHKNSIFILGMFNSGSTLLARFVSCHIPHCPILPTDPLGPHKGYESQTVLKLALESANIPVPLVFHMGLGGAGLPEMETLATYGVGPFLLHGYTRSHCRCSPGHRESVFKETLDSLMGPSRAYIKVPMLFFCQPLLTNLYPEHKKLLIIREGHTFASSKNQWKKGPDKGESLLLARARYWNALIDGFFEFWEPDKTLLTISYEKLCEDQDREMARISEFLGLPSKSEAYVKAELADGKWNKVPADLQEKVLNITRSQQERIDTCLG